MAKEIEIWLPVVGYKSYYEVSNLGRVKHLYREWRCGKHSGLRKMEEYVMSQYISKKGYPIVNLRMSGDKQKSVKVHRIVAEAFVLNPKKKPQVNHKNGIKTDNRAINLEWTTNQENVIHSYKNGLQIAKSGGEQGQARLVLNKQTGIFYECIKDAADSLSRVGKNNYSWLYKKLTGYEKNITSYILV